VSAVTKLQVQKAERSACLADRMCHQKISCKYRQPFPCIALPCHPSLSFLPLSQPTHQAQISRLEGATAVWHQFNHAASGIIGQHCQQVSQVFSCLPDWVDIKRFQTCSGCDQGRLCSSQLPLQQMQKNGQFVSFAVLVHCAVDAPCQSITGWLGKHLVCCQPMSALVLLRCGA
jgi:hypothetical protein